MKRALVSAKIDSACRSASSCTRKFDWAALYAAAGAVLSFFGFIHGTALGIGNSTPVAFGYLLVAGVCYALSRQSYPAAVVLGEEAAAED